MLAGPPPLLSGGRALIPAHDIAVLVGWLAAGLLLSLRFFRWTPHRPRHARTR